MCHCSLQETLGHHGEAPWGHFAGAGLPGHGQTTGKSAGSSSGEGAHEPQGRVLPKQVHIVQMGKNNEGGAVGDFGLICRHVDISPLL